MRLAVAALESCLVLCRVAKFTGVLVGIVVRAPPKLKLPTDQES
jgi:hypothetical protein